MADDDAESFFFRTGSDEQRMTAMGLMGDSKSMSRSAMASRAATAAVEDAAASSDHQQNIRSSSGVISGDEIIALVTTLNELIESAPRALQQAQALLASHNQEQQQQKKKKSQLLDSSTLTTNTKFLTPFDLARSRSALDEINATVRNPLGQTLVRWEEEVAAVAPEKILDAECGPLPPASEGGANALSTEKRQRRSEIESALAEGDATVTYFYAQGIHAQIEDACREIELELRFAGDLLALQN